MNFKITVIVGSASIGNKTAQDQELLSFSGIIELCDPKSVFLNMPLSVPLPVSLINNITDLSMIFYFKFF